MGNVEGSPEAILHDVADETISINFWILRNADYQNLLVRRGVEGSIHGANATDQADTEDKPWVHGHEAK